MKKSLIAYNTYAEYNSELSVSALSVPRVVLIRNDRTVIFVPYDEKYESVDLGLPSGTLWSKINVGAEDEADCGPFLSFGETNLLQDKQMFEWSTYKFSYPPTKYSAGEVLSSEDDAATQVMGSEWQMPTLDDVTELFNYTNKTWVTKTYSGNTVNGFKFTSKSNSNNYIFIPAAGYKVSSQYLSKNAEGFLWTKTMSTSANDSAYCLHFDGTNTNTMTNIRFVGYNVRGVKK